MYVQDCIKDNLRATNKLYSSYYNQMYMYTSNEQQSL